MRRLFAEGLNQLVTYVEVVLVGRAGLGFHRVALAGSLVERRELAVRVMDVGLVLQRQLEASQDDPRGHQRLVVGTMKLLGILQPLYEDVLQFRVVCE